MEERKQSEKKAMPVFRTQKNVQQLVTPKPNLRESLYKRMSQLGGREQTPSEWEEEDLDERSLTDLHSLHHAQTISGYSHHCAKEQPSLQAMVTKVEQKEDVHRQHLIQTLQSL